MIRPASAEGAGRRFAILPWVTAGFAVLVIAASVLASLGKGFLFYRIVRRIPGGDKTGHFILMGVLSFLTNSSLDCRRLKIGPFKPLKGTVILLALATVDELLQIFLVHRTFALRDLGYGAAGVLIFGWAAALWSYLRRPPQALEQ